MKKTILAAASALALTLSAPAFAAHNHGSHGSHGSSGGRTGDHTGSHRGSPLGTGGRHGGTGHHNNPFVIVPGGHTGFQGHRGGFDIYRHTLRAPHRYHYGSYRRPFGWYYRNWGLGDILPALFFGQQYWLSDYYDFGLEAPPPGTVWVRYGDDALLIDRDTGEVIQVVHGVFY